MMAQTTPTPRTFKGGLVLAGAVSGGSYMAGVLDFLIQALEEWEGARATDTEEAPPHRFVLRSMSGASAGSISASIMARVLASSIVPVTDVNHPPDQPEPNPADETRPFENPLYAGWVQSIDIKHLLGDTDLQVPNSELLSALDSSVLPHIGRNVLNVGGAFRPKRPGYVAERLDLFVNSTNLRGVPYSIGFKDATGNYRHMMDRHADYKHFELSWNASSSPPSQAVRLDPSKLAPSGSWGELISASLASGAFPVGLAPRLLERKALDYDAPGRGVPPDWPEGIKGNEANYTYEYLNVDGGTINNEPLELARVALSGASDKQNPRKGTEANAAVIMIDPFPNTSSVKANYEPQKNLIQVIGRLVSMAIEQMRFKRDEIELAWKDDNYSRFAISPIYSEDGRTLWSPAIMGELLGAFGAFLSASFRRHDFQLGRRNCQNFLRRYFVLPETNPLFGDWSDRMKDDYGVDKDGVRHLPVIPLVSNSVSGEIPLPARPRSSEVDINELSKSLRGRVDAVVPKLISSIPNTVLRTTLNLIWKAAWLFRQRQKIADWLVGKIEAELSKLDN